MKFPRQRAADLGIDHIDTADLYSCGVSETYIGKAVAGRRDRFVIASKVGLPVGDGPNDAAQLYAGQRRKRRLGLAGQPPGSGWASVFS